MKLTKDQTTWAKREDIKKVLNKYHDKKERDEELKEELAIYDFVASVKLELVKRHMTKYALAKKAGLKPQVVSSIIDGAKNAEYRTLSKIAYGIDKKLVLKLV